nr:uncharacterized protein LOC124811261 [Hydra vulgaris]
MNKMKNKIFDDAYKNIEKSQKRQKHDYDKRIAPNNEISINKKVLLRNSRRDDRKGGKLVKPWTGPYIVTSISSTNNCTLKNLKGQILKTKYNLTKLCLYNEKITNDEQEITFDEINMQISNDKIGKYATIEMRTSISEKFGIGITKNIFIADVNLLSRPKQIHKTIGDGNCFFRAISYIITGSECSYEIIRKKVVKHMCTHINNEMTLYMNQSIITYLNESGMSDNTTWATDAEIIGCASFMGIDIKVYSKYGEKLKWLTYPCSLTLTQLSEHAIFLDNSTAGHFNVVLL